MPNKKDENIDDKIDERLINKFNNLTPEGKVKVLEYIKMVFLYEKFFDQPYFENPFCIPGKIKTMNNI